MTPRPSARAAQRGLSLIELMVGLTIGLFLTLGLFTLISNTSNSFKVQDDFARLQDNAAGALRQLGDSLRLAAFFGYGVAGVIDTTVGGVNTTTDCGSATNLPATNWALNLAVPIIGISGLTSATVNATVPCISAANYLDVGGGQQMLVTRGALGFRIPDPNGDGNLGDGLAAQRNFTTTIYVQSDPASGLLFYGADYATLRGAGTTRTLASGRDIDIFELAVHLYYLRPCSRFAAGMTVCNAAADDGRPVPTLVRQELRGSAMTEATIAEGIERMSLLFGIDNANNDGVADTFLANPAAGDWANVVAVRVALLVRSTTPAAHYDDSNKAYDLDGDGTADYRCTTDTAGACNYKRKVFTQLFQLRNIAQRRGS